MPNGFSYSSSTPNLQMSEEERRRKLLDQELGPLKDQISREEYEKLLQRQRTVTPVDQVDQKIRYSSRPRTQREESRVESGSQQRVATQKSADDLLRQSKEGKITPGQYAQRFQQLTGVPVPGGDLEEQKKRDEEEQAKEIRRRYGRDVSDAYMNSIKQAKENGLYDADFQDNLFGTGAFNGMKGRSRRGWTKEDYAREYRMLNDEVEEFESVRQQLTENYQRLDPFARTQYNEMSKRIQGLERARQNGQVRPIEYLRAMGTLANQSQQVKWKYHMRQPGQSPGEISNQNGMMMQMTQEGPKPIGLTPDYIKQNTFTGQDGSVYIPKLVKGEITYEAAEDKNQDRIPDVMQMKDLAKDFDDKVQAQFANLQSAWAEANPLEEPQKHHYDKWMNEARAFVLQQEGFNAKAMQGVYGNDQQMMQGVQQHIDSERQAVQQADQESMQQRAEMEGQMMRQQQDEQDQAIRQAAIEQKVEEGMDPQQAERLVDDDIYATQDAQAPGRARQLRASQPLPFVEKAEQNAYRSMINKAKTKKDVRGIVAEHWSKDPMMTRKVMTPIPWRPGTKPRENEVYLMPRKDKSGYDRLWYKDGKMVRIKMPEERTQEKETRDTRAHSRQKLMDFGTYAGV